MHYGAHIQEIPMICLFILEHDFTKLFHV
jgi:hypothetical protein